MADDATIYVRLVGARAARAEAAATAAAVRGMGTATTEAGAAAEVAEKRVSGLQAASRRLAFAGRLLTYNITLPLALLGHAAVNMHIQFEESMEKIHALVGASAQDMQMYRKTVLSMAEDVGKSPIELADALYFVTSSGFAGAAALDVLEESAKASAAGLGQTKTVADAVTSAVNAYGEANLSAALATDILAATVRVGKAEPEELAGSIGRVIPLAQEMGVSFDQVGSALASMTLSGLDAAEATTALRAIMTSFLKPTEQGAKFLESLGLSTEILRDSIRERGLLPTLIDLRDTIGDNQEALADIFPNVRALTGFLNLTGRNVEKNREVFAELADSTGEAGAAFEKIAQTPIFRMRQGLAKLQAQGIEFGAILIPILSDVVGVLAMMAGAFNMLPGPIKQVVVGFLVFMAIMGPVLLIVSGVLQIIELTSLAIGFLAANPIVLIIAAIALLVVALWTAYERSETFRSIVNAIGSALSDVFGFIRDNWQWLGPLIAGPFALAWVIIKPIIETIQASIETVKSAIEWLEEHNPFSGSRRARNQAALSAFQTRQGVAAAVTYGGPAVPGARPIADLFTNIPWLAGGGELTTGGWAIVGEHGPELAHLPSRAVVQPLSRHSISATADPPLSSALGRTGGGDQGTLNVNLVVDGKVLAKTVIDRAEFERARR